MTDITARIDKINQHDGWESIQIRAMLRLSAQWVVTGARFDTLPEAYASENPNVKTAVKASRLKSGPTQGKVTIFVSPRDGRRYLCPCCGSGCKPMCYEVRRYAHVPMMEHACEIQVRIPKLKCFACGSTRQVSFPAAEPRVSYTRPLSERVLAELMGSTKSKASVKLGVSFDVIDSILDRSIASALRCQDLSGVTGVYVDETQFGHGQDYISVFSDQNHHVIYACRGHDKSVLSMFRDFLIAQGGDPENIRVFSADMSRAFESGISDLFPNADLVWDRFHLIKMMGEAVNSVRKRTLRRKEGERLSHVKYVVLRRFDNLSDSQKDRLESVRLYNPELAEAYDMKEVFSQIVLMRDPTEMLTSLEWWFRWVSDSGAPELRKKVEALRCKMDRILAWTRHRVSNSVCEGINKNIQDIRRSGCGYTNLRNFLNMILLRQGGLTFYIRGMESLSRFGSSSKGRLL